LGLDARLMTLIGKNNYRHEIIQKSEVLNANLAESSKEGYGSVPMMMMMMMMMRK
jgi:hypothetical protein